MTRDYAKRVEANQAPVRKGTPGWLWMVGGLVIGLFVAGLVYLNEHQKSLPKETRITANVLETLKAKAKGEAAPPTAPAPAETKANEPAKSRFDFYTILPELEVVIPEAEVRPEALRDSPQANERYILQVGSFRTLTQADSLKARLALLGFEADIQSVDSNGDSWHRVRLGPFDSYRAANRDRNRLLKNEIQSLLIKVKAEG